MIKITAFHPHLMQEKEWLLQGQSKTLIKAKRREHPSIAEHYIMIAQLKEKPRIRQCLTINIALMYVIL